MNNWIYNNKTFTINDIQDNISFVYLITNTTTGKKYIGKKTFYFSQTKVLKGKRIRSKVLSDWQTYWGSNKILKAEVAIDNTNYTREIIYLCKTKSEASYLETYEIFYQNALLSDAYYNDWVTCKISRSHLQKHIKKIYESIKKIN